MRFSRFGMGWFARFGQYAALRGEVFGAVRRTDHQARIYGPGMHQTPGQPQHPYGQQPQHWPAQQPYAPPPRPRKRRTGRIVLAIIGVVVGLFVLIGVLASSDGGRARSTSSAAPTAAAFTERPPAGVREPTKAQRELYLAALAEIDPGLTVNTNRVMRRAYRVCDRILRPVGGTKDLIEYTVLELSGGNATIDEAQARQVIRAVKVWCR